MPPLPLEVWSHIFSFIGVIYYVADSSSDAWVKVVTGNAIHRDMPNPVLREYYEMKNAISVTCRRFYDASRDFVLESIYLETIGSVRYLASRLTEDPGLANAITRCTRRIDVHIEMRNGRNLAFLREHNISSERGMQQIREDIESVVRLCPNLAYFSCHVDGNDISKLIDVLHDACPSLEVLRWYFAYSVFILPIFSRLCVLDLSFGWPSLGQFLIQKPNTLPHLHTLIGPLNAIDSCFRNTDLPSLRALVLKRSSNFVDVDLRDFFQRHGENLESLDAGHQPSFFRLNLHQYLPQLTELIVNSEDKECIGASWPKVWGLGLFGDAVDGDLGAQRILRALDVVDSIRDDGNWASLRTVRIFNERAVRYLRRQKRLETVGCEGRLKSWSISLEDGRGNLLISPRMT